MGRTCRLEAIAILASLLCLPVLAEDSRDIEEIVVTGSYIKYAETFDHSSPLRVIDESYFEAQGTTDLVVTLPCLLSMANVFLDRC